MKTRRCSTAAATLLVLAAVSFQQVLAVVGAGPSSSSSPPPPAMFVFGDGALDVGNNNDLSGGEIGDPPRANHLYYGIDFPPAGNNPTGRFSNGYNIADFIGNN
jgi:hypothetical protein